MDFNHWTQGFNFAMEDGINQETVVNDSKVGEVVDVTPAGGIQAADMGQAEVVEEESVTEPIEVAAGSTALAALVPHCAVMLVLDTSHSMWGKGLLDMRQALAEFYGRMRDVQFPGASIDVAAVSMGENFGMLEDFVPVSESALLKVNIRPKGDTPIGAALSLALTQIHAREQEYRNRGLRVATSQLIVLTDGCNSSDEYAQVSSQIRRECEAGILECRAIAMGSAPDLTALRTFAGDKVVIPAFGGLGKSLETTAEDVSTRYEDEVVRRLAEDGIPEADKVFRADGFTGRKPGNASFEKRVHDSSRNDGARQSSGTSFSEGCAYLLDGSNIMYWNRDCGPCLDPVLAITDEFDRQGISYIVIFDASARHVLEKKAGAGAQLQRLYKRKEQFKEAPAGVQADAFLLSVADRRPESIIISNDLYRDYQKNYPWLKQAAGRRMTGMVLNGEVVAVGGGKGKDLHFPMPSAEKQAI